MINQSDKIERFAEVINENAQKQCKKIEKQTSKFKKRQRVLIESEISAEAERGLSYEIGRLRTEINREISKMQRESTLSVCKRRSEIEQEVFSAVRERLVSFAKTEEYKAYLSRCISELFGAADGRLKIFVRECDVPEAEKIAASLSKDAEIVSSPEIIIGGAAAENENGTVFVNNTLEAGLERQREEFRLMSGLTINE